MLVPYVRKGQYKSNCRWKNLVKTVAAMKQYAVGCSDLGLRVNAVILLSAGVEKKVIASFRRHETYSPHSLFHSQMLGGVPWGDSVRRL